MSSAVKTVASGARLAASRIGAIVRETPLVHSPALSEMTGGEVYLKLENLQHTGSFKLRGATNRLLTLSQDERARGCVAASSGNHGAAVAYAMQKLDVNGVIFVPEQTSVAKVEAIRGYGGNVRFYGTDGLDTEQHAREYAEQHDMVYLSPYNDPEVIIGQATCGAEIIDQLAELDAVFVAVGGGGLISGIGSVLKQHDPDIDVFGCQPEASAVMAKSIDAGRILDLSSDPTLSDGTAGGIEPDAITFALCAELVDDFILVSEDEIAAAMRRFMADHEYVVEGAAGVAVAAALARRDLVSGRKVVIVICGGNVSQATLDSISGTAKTQGAQISGEIQPG
ncbi:threonine/serine dehydratase [Gammaproteobacteria bacterium]|jgi:threonine dehydratase|nr:threonine/serine dehydratase [Gammaproteobacteria bacterium]